MNAGRVNAYAFIAIKETLRMLYGIYPSSGENAVCYIDGLNYGFDTRTIFLVGVMTFLSLNFGGLCFFFLTGPVKAPSKFT